MAGKSDRGRLAESAFECCTNATGSREFCDLMLVERGGALACCTRFKEELPETKGCFDDRARKRGGRCGMPRFCALTSLRSLRLEGCVTLAAPSEAVC